MSHLLLIIAFAGIIALGIPVVFISGMLAFAYMFAASLMFAALEHFVYLTYKDLLLLACIVALAYLVELGAGILGARRGGANKKSLIGGGIGAIIGTIFIPIPLLGTFTGLFLGIYAAEALQHRSRKEAFASAAGGVMGAVAGSAVNVVLACLYLTAFILLALH